MQPLKTQPDVASIEQEVLDFWRTEKIFQQSINQRNGGKPFVIYDGPPTANAKPALHHMLPGTFKDTTGRYQAMRGRYVRRQAGWDTHGLPVEVQVEKALGLAGKREIMGLVPGDPAASIAMFNEACRSSVWQYKGEWDAFVERIGYWTDTEHPYITYDPGYIEGVWGVFKRIWEQGLVYKDYKIVPYCPRCGTGLSAAEVAQGYQDVKDVTAYVAFPLADIPNRSLLAWTTTPWTLPANTALAVNPKLTYVVVQQGEQQYVLAEGRLSVLSGDYTHVETVLGEQLLGLGYIPPFKDVLSGEGLKHTVVPADFVTDTSGTGIVHIAPMYGEDDFTLGKELGLVRQHTVGKDGRFLEDLGGLSGVYVREALGQLLTHLQGVGALYRKESITHSYPHCWRCKTALLYYAADSWFIRVSSKRAELLKANSEVTWVPEHIKDGRFGSFLAEARDWAISRERFWGTPLPIWASETGEYLCVGTIEELRALAVDPSQIGKDFDPHRPGVDDVVLQKDGVLYRREPLVLDVWFDSGSMPFASGRQMVGEFPADLIAEAVDQTRGWFYSLLTISALLEGQPSYRAAICIGHLVDTNGKKMSKSIGNVVEPFAAMQELGTDALRLYFLSVNDPGETKQYDPAEVRTGYRKNLLLSYNMVSYYLTYAPQATGGGKLQLLDHWLASRSAEVLSEMTAFLDQYDYLRAARTVERYIDDLSTWYLRRSRNRTDQAFFTFFHERLMELVSLLAPLTPFMSEYLYSHLRTKTDPQSVHLADWPESRSAQNSELVLMRDVRTVAALGQSVRAKAGQKVRQPLGQAWVTGVELTEAARELLQDELNITVLTVADRLPEGYPQAQEAGIAVCLDTTLSPELLEAGVARDLTRQLQLLRKNSGLVSGQQATLLAGPYVQPLIEPLFQKYPSILFESGLTVDPSVTWIQPGDTEIRVAGETVTLGLKG